jgi:tRNA dimethylallyltransferase
MQPDRPKPLVLVLGPTGSGKSDLALDIAQRFGGEIVNCDSLQVYRGFDIGTAKTPPQERRGIPHHLFDIVEPSAIFTAGDYARDCPSSPRRSRGARPHPRRGRWNRFLRSRAARRIIRGTARDEQLRAESRCARAKQCRLSASRAISSRPAAAARIHPTTETN